MAALSEAGWRLTEEGAKACGGSAKTALDLDLRDIGAECLPEEINRGKASILDGGIILQVSTWEITNKQRIYDYFSQSSTLK